MPKTKRRVFAAMSGGVDSSVAAFLLKQQGYEVVGAFMRNWTQPVAGTATNQWQRDEADARMVAEQLGIPFLTFDFEDEYRREVAGYMLREYAAGWTPNPDVMCNKAIKFGLFLERARELGAEYIATGHYVRMQKSKSKMSRKSPNEVRIDFRGSRLSATEDSVVPPRLQFGDHGIRETVAAPLSRTVSGQNDKAKCKIIYTLAQARDANKDQSYFLWTLTQEQLQYCLFPIGDYTKIEVRELARTFGLATADKPDSQGICFVGEVAVRDFLQEYLPAERGPVLTATGKRVGEHEGVALYTIGQRRGVGSVGGGTPYYVIEKDAARNALIVAQGPDDPALYGAELVAEEVNWVLGRPPKLPLACTARIRYRQPLQFCTLTYAERTRTDADSPRGSAFQSASVRVEFDVPQRAITPGQSVVFYRGSKMLGGGVICEGGRRVVER